MVIIITIPVFVATRRQYSTAVITATSASCFQSSLYLQKGVLYSVLYYMIITLASEGCTAVILLAPAGCTAIITLAPVGCTAVITLYTCSFSRLY